MRGGTPDTPAALAVGRQPAEGRRSRARSPGTRTPSSPRSRRAAWTSARSSSCTAGCSPSATPGRAILLFSLELDEVRSLADRILVIYEGRIVASCRRRDRRGARPAHDRRRRRRGAAERSSPGGPRRGAGADPRRRRDRRARYLARRRDRHAGHSRRSSPSSSAASSCSSPAHNPIDTYKAIFDGTGLQWLFPWPRAPTATPPRSTSSRRC